MGRAPQSCSNFLTKPTALSTVMGTVISSHFGLKGNAKNLNKNVVLLITHTEVEMNL